LLEFQVLCGERLLDPALVLEDLRAETGARELARDLDRLGTWLDTRY
jgi:hypothetical protein